MPRRRAVAVAAVAAGLLGGTAVAPDELPPPAVPELTLAKDCAAGYRHRRYGRVHWC